MMYMIGNRRAWTHIFAVRGDRSFQKSGALMYIPNSRALILRTPTERTPRLQGLPPGHNLGATTSDTFEITSGGSKGSCAVQQSLGLRAAPRTQEIQRRLVSQGLELFGLFCIAAPSAPIRLSGA